MHIRFKLEKHGHKAKFIFTGTSLVYWTGTNYIYEDFYPKKDMFEYKRIQNKS